jgi:hypothetical protein
MKNFDTDHPLAVLTAPFWAPYVLWDGVPDPFDPENADVSKKTISYLLLPVLLFFIGAFLLSKMYPKAKVMQTASMVFTAGVALSIICGLGIRVYYRKS